MNCQHRSCIDDAVVAVQFQGGEKRVYCRFHADHLAGHVQAEVTS